jgi:hypothetical protein
LTGTVFEGTRISLRTWIGVIDDWARATSPLDLGDIAARYGLSGEAARQLRRRVAAALDEVRMAPVGGQLPGASQD